MWQMAGAWACMAVAEGHVRQGGVRGRRGMHGMHAPPWILLDTVGQCTGSTHSTGIHSCS